MNRPHIDEHGKVDLPSFEALGRQDLSKWLYERLHGFDINLPSDPRDGSMPHYLVSLIYPKLSRAAREDVQSIMLDFVKELTINPQSSWRNEPGEELLMLTDPVLVQSNKREDTIDLLRQLAEAPVMANGSAGQNPEVTFSVLGIRNARRNWQKSNREGIRTSVLLESIYLHQKLT